jgi:histidine triad (HIT) family protein
MSCVFCEIVAGKIPSYLVYEDEQYLAFLDIFPLSEGHTLLIPKQHYTHVWDVPAVGEYFATARALALHLKRVFDLEYVDASVLGRGVPHAHIHLRPFSGRWKTLIQKEEQAGTTGAIPQLTAADGTALAQRLYTETL